MLLNFFITVTAILNVNVHSFFMESTSLSVSDPSASVPAIPGKFDTIYTVEPKRATFTLKRGNGEGRIVVMKPDAPIGNLILAGIEYYAHSSYAYGSYIDNDEFVVYAGNDTVFTVYNLYPDNQYFLKVYEYNVGEEEYFYNITAADSLNIVTPGTPAVTGNVQLIEASLQSITLKVNAGDGNARLLLMSQGGAPTFVPWEYVPYTAEPVWGAQNVAPGTYAVYNSSSAGNDTVEITNLAANTNYHFALFEANGSITPIYRSTPYRTQIATLNSAGVRPTNGVSNLILQKREGNFADVSFSSGSGNGRLIVGTRKNTIDFIPVDGVSYTPGNFGQGQNVGTDEYILKIGNFTSANIQGLVYDSSYKIKIFEFDENNGAPLYNTTDVAAIDIPFIAVPSGDSRFNSIWGRESRLESSILNFYFDETAEDKNRLVIISINEPVNFIPVQYQSYPISNDWYTYNYYPDEKENFIAAKGNINHFGLMPAFAGRQFYIRVFDYVGNESPVYNIDTFYDISFNTSSVRWKPPPPEDITDTIVQHPTIPPTTNGYIQVLDSTATFIKLRLHPGNGVGRMLVGRRNGSVSWSPLDSTYYSYSTTMDAVQGNAQNSILYRVGSLAPVDITVTNVGGGSTYDFELYEYNGVWQNVYYKGENPVDTGDTEQPPLLQAPTLPASAFVYTQPDGKSAGFSFTKGNGTHRMIFASTNENFAVDFNELDTLVANSNFGSGIPLTGNVYLVGLTPDEHFTMNNLDTSASYYLKMYEVNIDSEDFDNWLVQEDTSLNFTVNTIGMPDGNLRVKQWWIREGRLGNPTANIKLSLPDANESRLVHISLKQPSDWEPVQFQKYVNGDWDTYVAYPEDTNGVIVYIGKDTSISILPFFNHDQVYVKVWEMNGVNNPVYNLTNYYKINFDAADLRVKENILVDPTDTIVEPVYSAPSLNGHIVVRGTSGSKKNLTIHPGNGMGRVLVMSTNPDFDFTPADNSYISYNSVYGDVPVGTDQYMVYLAGGRDSTNITISGINVSQQYYYALYEYNGMFNHVFKTTPYVYSEVAAPTAASSLFESESTEGNLLKGSFEKGNGVGRLIIVSDNNTSPLTLPLLINAVNAQPAYGNGTAAGTGAYIVGSGDIDTVEVTGLTHSTSYYFTIVEYNLQNGEMIYAQDLKYQINRSTLFAPPAAIQIKNIQVNNEEITISLNQPPPEVKRLILLTRAGLPASQPSQYFNYSADTVYGNGDAIANSYVVYNGTDSLITITSLIDSNSYYLQLFEYYGTVAPVYNLEQYTSDTISMSHILSKQLVLLPIMSSGNRVSVNWEITPSEQIDGFIIQRTAPGSSIKENLGEVKANVSTTHYSYMDYVNINGEHKYQIIVKWKNGEQYLSKTGNVLIAEAEKKKIVLYPNPATTHFRVTGVDQKQIRLIRLFNNEGKLVKEWQMRGDNYYQLPSVLSKLYYIVVVTDEKNYVEELTTQP